MLTISNSFLPKKNAFTSFFGTVPATIAKEVVDARKQVLRQQDVVLKTTEQAKTDPSAVQAAKQAQISMAVIQQAVIDKLLRERGHDIEVVNLHLSYMRDETFRVEPDLVTDDVQLMTVK